MSFPASSLKPKSGTVHCLIHENTLTGLARDLFWSFTVDFEPLLYCGDEWTCSMCCEWVRWPIRDWRALEGQRLESDDLYDANGPEASFYMTEHHPADSVRLWIAERRGTSFRVSLSMLVDFQGYAGGDENPEMLVECETELLFTGLLIVRDNLFPKPSTSEEAASIAHDFVDIERFEPPELDDFRYMLRPRLESAL